MPGLKERAKNLVELIDSAKFLYADRPIVIDDKAQGAAQPGGARDARRADDRPVAASSRGPRRRPKSAVRAFAERKDIKLGAVAQPLRAALTGRTTSPGIFEVLQVLGKPESLARLADQARR